MKKIGIVTLWSKNYGSVLQCYALRKVIKSMGFYPQVYYQSEHGIKKQLHRVKTVGELVIKSLRFPSYFRTFKEIKTAGKKSVRSLSDESANSLDLFVKHSIQPVGRSYSELKRIARGEEHAFFVCGSDQIWNGSVPYNKISFLQFAPREKRVSYAPSFGTSKIENYNKKEYAKAISSIPYLSVREEVGVDIIQNLCNRKAVRLPDPTVLLTNEEWDEFCHRSKITEHDYILLHFLDRPSSTAIEVAIELQKNTGLRFLTFGYPHDDISGLTIEHVDGGPEDYISIIKNAEYICTDSFHTCIFSIRNMKQFYVFPRQYTHNYEQSSRIKTLLDNCNYQDRMISTVCSYDNLPFALHETKDFFIQERQLGIGYLSKIFETDKVIDIVPKLKSDMDCTGCGLCSVVCKHNAISMITNSVGALMPLVNETKCIKCGLCSRICDRNIYTSKEREKIAYISYNSNKQVILESASGGVFAALAREVINQNGAVYGAVISFGETINVEHKVAYTHEDLLPILKSKYVQSDCSKVFSAIKADLSKGMIVLFGGTSCQVAAIRRYLGMDFENLYLVDLVCHGVPGIDFFRNYVRSLEKKYKSEVVDFTFRNKNGGTINYEETVTFKSGLKIIIPWRESNYYKQFLRCESYRESCYNCEFATIDKPSDITIGDYFEAKSDYPELFNGENSLNDVSGISCVIVQNNKGRLLLDEFGKELIFIPVEVEKVQNSHNQLCFPSRHSSFRRKLFSMYRKGGFDKINSYYRNSSIALFIPRKCYRLFRGALRYLRR